MTVGMAIPSSHASYRLSFISDIHQNAYRLGREVARAKEEGRKILCSGDYLSSICFRGRKNKIRSLLDESLSTLDTLGPGNVVATYGNHDPEKHVNYVMKTECNIAYVHGKRMARLKPSTTADAEDRSHHELSVVGFGGSERRGKSATELFSRAFFGSSVYSYNDIYASVKESLDGMRRNDALYDTILLAHQSPYGILDRSLFSDNWRKLPEGESRKAGSKALRDVLDEYSPFLVAAGHIHEDPGIAVRTSLGEQPMEAKYDAKSGTLDLSKIDRERLRDGGISVVMPVSNASEGEIIFGIEKKEKTGIRLPTFYLNSGSLGYEGVHCDVDLDVSGGVEDGKSRFERVLKFRFIHNK